MGHLSFLPKDIKFEGKCLSLHFTILFSTFFFIPVISHAQYEQLWLEYRPTYNFKNDYKAAMRASYRTNFYDPRWYALEGRFMPEKKLNSHFDVLAGIQFVETKFTENIETFESRLIVGGRWRFTPNKRIDWGFYPRLEYRNIQSQHSEYEIKMSRLRLRLYANIPLNQLNLTSQHVCYAITNIEFFILENENLKDFYTNRLWLWLGLGYKLNNSLKIEVVYNYQETQIPIGSDKIIGFNIFRLIIRHTLSYKDN